MLVQYVHTKVMVGVDLLQPIKVVDEYRFENFVHPFRLDAFRHFAGTVRTTWVFHEDNGHSTMVRRRKRL
jgi:hypothetical protein